MRRVMCGLGLAMVLAAPSPAQAALITITPAWGPVIDFSQFVVQQSVGAGVQVGTLVGEDVFLTAVGDHRVGPMNHGLGANGSWTRSGALNNDSAQGMMTFTFNDGPVSGVGGFVNYAPGFGTYIIEALGAGGIVLESYDIAAVAPISTPAAVNDGAFRGILRGTNDIVAFRLSFGFNVIDDLAFTRADAAVPEPATLFLMGGGMAVAALRRRKLSRS